jgi:ABC-type antimicrobial peptide transport system permease subunit
VFGVDPESWLNSAFWLDYFTLYHMPAVSIPQLSDMSEDRLNILTSFKPVEKYTIDSIGNRYPVYSNYLNLQLISDTNRNVTPCVIVDLMTARVSDQSSGPSYVPGKPDASDFLVADLNFVQTQLNTTQVSKFYIKINPGVNYTRVMDDIAVLDTRAAQSIYGTYTLNVLFSIIYLTIGMSIVSIVRVRGLRKQYSVLRALGAPNKSIIVASLIETGVGVLLAAIIGGTIGLCLALLLMNVPLLYMGLSTTSVWNRLPVQPVVPIPLISVIIGISFAVAFIATYYVVVRTLKLNIAEEIQYNE